MSCFQGVTLTDLQEAEKTIKPEYKGKERTKEEEEKEAKQKKGEEGVRKVEIVDLRSKIVQCMLRLSASHKIMSDLLCIFVYLLF